jgi:hypothetical protein
MDENTPLKGGVLWKRNAQSARKFTRRLTPRKNTAATPAPNKPTKEDKPFLANV